MPSGRPDSAGGQAMGEDLLAAIQTILAAAFYRDYDDHDIAQETARYAFTMGGQASSSAEGFVTLVSILTTGVGLAWAEDRPELAQVLLEILQAVAIDRVRPQIIAAQLATLEEDLAEVHP